MAVDGLGQVVPDEAEKAAEEESTKRLATEQQQDARGADLLTTGQPTRSDPGQHREQDHADAVVEQALTGDEGLDLFRHPSPAQEIEHRYRVGGGDQCAQQKSADQGDVEPDEPEHSPGREADDGRADQRAEDRQDQHRVALLDHLPGIQAERAGEQEQREDPVEHEGGKVQPVEDGFRELAQPQIQAHFV